MKLRTDLHPDLDVWECECGTHTPLKKGSPQPTCEYCRRVKTLNCDCHHAKLAFLSLTDEQKTNCGVLCLICEKLWTLQEVKNE
jgi:hypothetical protein